MALVDRLWLLALLVVSLGIHEWAHAWTALRCGDDTAARAGRLTMNPLAHIDPFGLLPVLLGFFFGWAKPVPVNPARVRNPAVSLPLISAAGPLSNIVQLLAGCALWWAASGFLHLLPVGADSVVRFALVYYVRINMVLALFNLIPVYPLDGAKIVPLLLTDELGARYEKTFERLGFLPLIGLFVADMAMDGRILGAWFGLWGPVFDPVFRLVALPH